MLQLIYHHALTVISDSKIVMAAATTGLEEILQLIQLQCEGDNISYYTGIAQLFNAATLSEAGIMKYLLKAGIPLI